ncbi:diguanylate cyclase domain-containing protein [Rhizobium sp. SL86]|uniref:diguanylate cyclase domain-containing protein n=1 Tax=Rhizobium sp. SL86 TaxID=2995148 RepID=UPI0022748484|nr:diguanylate cyclase [Rhizobium sp. SL86]MCY1668206.1 diguanylate cyclase [Rhizobium sp. SL86]
MSTTSYGSTKEASIGRQAMVVLTRLGLDLTPANFHLVSLLLKGENAELKRSFQHLKRPVSQADLTDLAHRFLPFLFEPAEQVVEALALAPVLPKVETSLKDMQVSLQAFEEQLAKAQAVMAATPEPAAAPLAHMVNLLKQSAGEQVNAVAELQASLSQWLADMAPAGQKDDAPDAVIAPMHALSPTSSMPDNIISHGLGERATMMSRLQALHSGEQHLDGYSLMLCRVSGFDAYRSPAMAKARDYLLDTIGQQTGRLIGKDDSACWMSVDELGLLLNSNNEIHLIDVSNRLRHVVDGALGHARRTVKDLPALNCRFGCATAYGTASPAQLYGSARLALQRAELTEDEKLVINAVAPLAANQRYHAIYGRHYQ